jgi:hypothetical protein
LLSVRQCSPARPTHASDWYFENIPNPVANSKALPDGSSADRFIEQNRADGAASLITVPLIGWTPKSRALSCGFSVKKYGKQQASDPYNRNCGNGVRSNSSFVKKNLPGDTSKRISASFVGGWVKYLVHKYGRASSGGVPFAAWYLRQLAAYQKKTGRRLLDYFDNHWYPQENGVTSNADGPAEQALRLRSTRMLWDPQYKDQSWINQPVMAIPRMKQRRGGWVGCAVIGSG